MGFTYLYALPRSPKIKTSLWAGFTDGKAARWTRYDETWDGKTINEERIVKPMASAAAAKAQVAKWIGERRAEGWVSEEELASLKKARPAAKPAAASKSRANAKPSAWLSKVDKRELARLRALIAKAKLSHRGAEIESLLRPAIRFTLRPATKSSAVTSRFGGQPDVPPGFKWPMRGKTPLAFVAQFRFDELAKLDLAKRLPATGLLSMFVYLVPDGDDYCARAALHYFADTKKLARMPIPAGTDGPTKQAVAVPELALTLPSPDDRGGIQALRLTDEERERYHDNVWLKQRNKHQLLGWDPELLARIDSDSKYGLEIGDVEALEIRLSAKRLAAKDVRAARVSVAFD